MLSYFIIYVCATAVSLPVAVLSARWARAKGIVDQPGPRKVHSLPVPRVGGIAIVVATIGVAVPWFLLSDVLSMTHHAELAPIIGLLLGAIAVFTVGLIDDIRGVRVRYKLLVQLAAAGIVCALGTRVDSVGMEGLFQFHLGWLSWPITIVWIVGITNAINLIDGLDGLAAGISAIACAVIAVFSLYTGQGGMVVLMAAMLGGLTGFLVFGFNPARIFLGDCGSLFLGFMLAAGSVVSSTKTMTAVGLALPMLAMGVPIFDTLLSMVRRGLARRPMFSPDRGHIHHRLLEMGLRHRHVVLVLYGVTLLCGGLGMFMMVTKSVGTLLVFACVVTLMLSLLWCLGVVRPGEAVRRLRDALKISRFRMRISMDVQQPRLMLRESRAFRKWWLALCFAAEKLELSYVCLGVVDAAGLSRSLKWRSSSEFSGAKNLMQVHLPADSEALGPNAFVKIGVSVTEGLEMAGYRAKLMARLIDECRYIGPRPRWWAWKQEESGPLTLRKAA